MVFLIPFHLIVSYWSYKRLFFETGKIFFILFVILGSIGIYFIQLGFIVVFLLHSLLILVQRNRTQEFEYENSKAIFEGGGIMRGLTSVEAAILLGFPYHEVLSLLFTELSIKKIINTTKDDPFQISISNKMNLAGIGDNYLERKSIRKEKAQLNHLIIYPFEEEFIEFVEQNEGNDLEKLDFTFLIEPLVERVADRVGGFDLEQTKTYYAQIIKRVSVEIGAGDFLFLTNDDSISKNIGWMMLDGSLSDNLLGKNEQLIPTLKQYYDQIQIEMIRKIYKSMLSHKGKYSVSIKLGSNINLATAQFLADTNRATFTG